LLVSTARLRIYVVKIANTFSAIAAILLSGLIVPHAHAAFIFTNVLSFEETNGASPEAALTRGSDGNLYGTTFSGGPGGTLTNGTIFKITPSGTFTSLIPFNGTNGAGPRAGMIQGADGNFYGTTYSGGTNNAGTVFQFTTNGTLTTLLTFGFDVTVGAYPIAGLVQGRDGNFYGTTVIGGTNNYGTVFRLGTNGAFALLVSFDNTNGASPYAGLVQANDGSLYGTTYQGGTNGQGTIYRLTTNGTFTSVYSFTGTNDGGNPYAGLVQGGDGNFYGTTFYGGTNGNGTVFKFSTNGTLTTLVSFDGTNGANPQGGVLQATDGNFYGTTFFGGTNGDGTIFKLTTNGVLTTLISFDGTNGAAPEAGLIQSTDGSFYGTTTHGGTNGYGNVFRLGIIVAPPRFQTATSAGSILTLTWTASAGQNYQLQYATNLTQPTWSNLNSSITATNSVMTTLDTVGPDPQRFYRILLLP